MSLDVSSLEAAQRSTAAILDAAVRAERGRTELHHEDLREAAFTYLNRGGKRLRPLLVLLSAGAAGGDPVVAEPAALAVEVFHTWTLIHDDIIDKDVLRRGGPTVHAEFARKLTTSRHVRAAQAADYGAAVAILAGDYLQGVAVRLVLDAATEPRVSHATVHAAATLMQTTLVRDLVEGEILDVAFTHRTLDAVTEEELLDMYRQKSAALLGYCARVGAMLALDEPDPDAALPASLAAFATTAGIAFQIRDDVLGLTSTEARLGKPVGSDVREGKRTPVLLAAHARATAEERRMLDDVVGHADATPEELARARELLDRLGVPHARARAEALVSDAVTHLEGIPASRYRDRLGEWAQLLVERDA